MDEGQFDRLVERWEERDAWFKDLAQRWEERDRRWEERDRRWEENDREHRELMRGMWQRMELFDIRQEARHEEMLDQLRAGTEAIWRMLDRFGEGPQPAS
jgi:hypothetical protein